MSAHSSFVPDPGWPTIVELATELWGKPTARYRDDIRFGAKESKSVKPSANTFHDHESGEGGGYVDLCIKARGELPPRRNGNGHLKPWQDIATTYPYHNAAGDLILEVVRTLSGSPRFRQRKPLGGDRWKWSVKNIQGHDCLLYRLPELRGALFDDVDSGNTIDELQQQASAAPEYHRRQDEASQGAAIIAQSPSRR